MRWRLSKRSVITLAAVLLVLGAVGVWVWELSSGTRLDARARRHWKEEALAKMQQRIGDEPWLAAELERLKPAPPVEMGGWVGDEILVMKNGEWIICQNICSKQNWRIHDLFLGRGSDGKWYYSTFHFCVGKCVLGVERRPDSLSEFVDAYWLKPFDGRSDKCLKETWTPDKPYGDERRQAGANAMVNGSR